MKLDIYDVVQLLLVLGILGLIVFGKLSYMSLAFSIVLMVIVLFGKVLEMESRMEHRPDSKAEKLKEARKWDELVSRMAKMREELQARIGLVESKISSEKAVEERLSKLYEKIISIENRVTKTTKTLASSYDVLDRRIRRMETELGLINPEESEEEGGAE